MVGVLDNEPDPNIRIFVFSKTDYEKFCSKCIYCIKVAWHNFKYNEMEITCCASGGNLIGNIDWYKITQEEIEKMVEFIQTTTLCPNGVCWDLMLGQISLIDSGMVEQSKEELKSFYGSLPTLDR